jgi:hypothetical protein
MGSMRGFIKVGILLVCIGFVFCDENIVEENIPSESTPDSTSESTPEGPVIYYSSIYLFTYIFKTF